MRIAMLCSGHAVDDPRVMRKQAASLAGMGHEVIVFGRGEGGPAKRSGVVLHPLDPLGGGLARRARLVPKLAEAAAEWNPDVVACHEPESALAGLRVKRRTGARMLFDVHELFHESLSSRLAWPLRPAVRCASAALLRYLGRRADWVTVVSPFNLAFYRAARGDDRVEIIHNGPIMELFPPCRQDVAGPVTVCHEGNLDRGRGMVQLLEGLALARRHADVRLLVVGEVRPGARALFEEKTGALGLRGAVEMPGWVDYDGVGAVLSRGQIGVVAMQPTPNNYLSLSNKLYNYMCSAMPVIAPAGSATADLVLREDCGVAVDVTRPDAIAEAIVRLAGDRPLRERLGARGRRAIQQRYGWHVMEKRLAEIYAQLAR
jgi:hypothetical protein